MEDTEWTDALKKHGIIKDEPKPEVEEIPEPVAKEPKFATEEEEDAWLDDNADDDDFIRKYRSKRFEEMQQSMQKASFGEVLEITGVDYVQQVNQAGEGVWVVLLLYRQSHPISAQMQQIFTELAYKFRETKFLKSISTLCIANFPDENLPAVFVYQNGQLVSQLVGPLVFGVNKITADEVEWILSRTGAFTTTLEEDPRKKMKESRKYYQQFDSEDDSD